MSIKVDIICNDCNASCLLTHDLDGEHYKFEMEFCPFCGESNIDYEEIEEE